MSLHHWIQHVALTFTLLSGHVKFSLASDDKIYITTSEKNPCPAKPCVTLSQLAANLPEYLSDNMTIIFLQGKHNVDKKLVFENVSRIMAAYITYSHSQSVLEDGLIVCKLKYASFVFNKVNLVYIDGLNFMGCNHKFESVGKLTIVHASFQGNSFTGSAVELIDTTSAYIQQSAFTSNTNGNYLGPIGIFVYENNLIHYPDTVYNTTTYTNVGGALIVTKSELNISDTVFENNNAVVGGAIFSWKNSNITILNSSFSDNSATSKGSACFGGATYFESENYNKPGQTAQIILSIYNTTLIYNLACHQGGAISGFYSYIIIKNSHGFHNNIAVDGGVIGVVKTAVSIEDSDFEQNIAFSGGGVLAAFYETILSITSSTFVLNTADYGGAIMADSS